MHQHPWLCVFCLLSTNLKKRNYSELKGTEAACSFLQGLYLLYYSKLRLQQEAVLKEMLRKCLRSAKNREKPWEIKIKIKRSKGAGESEGRREVKREFPPEEKMEKLMVRKETVWEKQGKHKHIRTSFPWVFFHYFSIMVFITSYYLERCL